MTMARVAHTPHHPFIFNRTRHNIASLFIVIIPILLLLTVGAFTHTDWNTLASAIGISFVRLVVAYGLSLVCGVTIAVLLSMSRFADALLPFFDVLQNVPSFALIPLFVLAFGYTSGMIVLFTATSVIWPIFFYSLSAMRNARTELADAATVFGAKGIKRIFDFLLPVAFPAIITGSIVGISIGWEAVIGIEIIGNVAGIGSFLQAASAGGSQTPVLVGISVLLLLTFFLNRLIWIPLLHKTRFYGE